MIITFIHLGLFKKKTIKRGFTGDKEREITRCNKEENAFGDYIFRGRKA